jgi:hypothetical protein
MNHPSMFRLVGISRRFFGETHVVISVWRDGTTWKTEYNILTRRPAEHLKQDVFMFDIVDYPAELPPVDAASMKGDGLQQAEMYLGLELEQLAMETNQEDFAYSRFILSARPSPQ